MHKLHDLKKMLLGELEMFAEKGINNDTDAAGTPWADIPATTVAPMRVAMPRLQTTCAASLKILCARRVQRKSVTPSVGCSTNSADAYFFNTTLTHPCVAQPVSVCYNVCTYTSVQYRGHVRDTKQISPCCNTGFSVFCRLEGDIFT